MNELVRIIGRDAVETCSHCGKSCKKGWTKNGWCLHCRYSVKFGFEEDNNLAIPEAALKGYQGRL